MKLTSFTAAGRRASYGIVVDGGIVDLGARFPERPTLRDFIAADGIARSAGLAGIAPDVALESVVFDPVIPNPDKIICVGLNYHDHVVETGRTVTANPVLFARYAGSQVGHGRPLVKPLESDEFDYEGELAVVIGKGGRRIPQEEALAHVVGYSCYNDGSVRDWQRHTSQFMPGKTFAGTGAFGPWLVTADEIPDPSALTLTTRLNGKIVQRTGLDMMITPIPAPVDLPMVPKVYEAHRTNFNALRKSSLDWSLLCPGPMIAASNGLPTPGLRLSVDEWPVRQPGFTSLLPKVALALAFREKLPELTICYEDAADVILTNLERNGPFSRGRVGIALPVGQRNFKADVPGR